MRGGPVWAAHRVAVQAAALALALGLGTLLSWPQLAQAQSGQGGSSAGLIEQQLEQQRAVGERQRALLAELRGSLASLSAEQQATLDQLDRLNAEIDRLRGETGALDAKLRQAEASLGVTERDIVALRVRVAELRRSVALNLDSLYRERSGDYLALLTQAQTLPELLLRLRWANYAGERQVATIQQLERETGRLQGELAAQEQTKKDLSALRTSRQNALAELAARGTEAQTLLAELRQTAAGQQALEAQGRAELQQTGQNIAELLDAAVQQREALAEQRRRETAARLQRDEQTAAQLRNVQPPAAQAASARTPDAQAAGSQAPDNPPAQAPASQAAAPAPAALPSAASPAAPVPPAAVPRPVPAPTAPAAPTTPAPPTAQELADARAQAEASVRLSAAELAPLRGRLDALRFPLPGGGVREPYSAAAPWTVLQTGTEGSDMVAAAEGEVLAVTSFSSLGWVVLLDHGGGLVTAYLGLLEPQAVVGQRLAAGDPVGTVGGSPVFGPDAAAFQVSRVEGEQRTPLPPPF